ncbi:MAG: type VII secretion protein EssB [Erysipelothrix sp.]
MKIKSRNYELDFKEIEDVRVYNVPKLDTSLKNVVEFERLNLYPEYLLPVEVSDENDNFIVKIQTTNLKTIDSVKTEDIENKLRFIYNLCLLKELVEAGINPMIHPNNMVVDINLIPKLYYRGIKSVLEPKEYSDADFLVEVKAMSVYLLSGDYDYEALVRSGNKIKQPKGIEKSIVECKSIEEIKDLVSLEAEKIKKNNYLKTTRIDKKKLKNNKIVKLSLGVTSGVMAIVIVYTFAFMIPFKNDQINATSYYLSNDYSQVLNVLNDYSISKLSTSSKYELADSSVQLSSLSKEQKELIRKQLSINSYEMNMDYWIYYGRGEYEKAHTTALALQDLELKYYAVVSYLEYLSVDTQMSASAKQALIQEYEGYRSTYENELKNIETNAQKETSKGSAKGE